jgi:hypothetical protein
MAEGYVVKLLYDDSSVAPHRVLARHGRGRLGILVSRADATLFPSRDEAVGEASIWMTLPNVRYTVIVEPA